MERLEPQRGLVIHYKLLFSHEAKTGLQEAREYHPCVVVGGRRDEEGNVTVRVMPISHTPPDKNVPAIELNHKIKNHLGLDSRRQWIKTHEVNKFQWPGLEGDMREVPAGPNQGENSYGYLPAPIVKDAIDQHFAHRARGQSQEASRDFDPKAEMVKLRGEREDAKKRSE